MAAKVPAVDSTYFEQELLPAEKMAQYAYLWQRAWEDCEADGDCRYQPLVFGQKGQLVRILRAMTVNGRQYLLGWMVNDIAPKHLLCRYNAVGYEPIPLYIKGDIGIVPAYDIGLMKPWLIPSVTYQALPGRTASVRFSSRVTIVNSEGYVVGQ